MTPAAAVDPAAQAKKKAFMLLPMQYAGAVLAYKIPNALWAHLSFLAPQA